MSICSGSLVALKALKAVRTRSPFVHQCQKELNDKSVQQSVGIYGSLDILEYEVMKSPMDLRWAAMLLGFFDPTWPWVSLGEIYRRGLVSGWSTSTGPNGEILVIPKAGLRVYLGTHFGYQGKIFDI